jgi:hypothetical protein
MSNSIKNLIQQSKIEPSIQNALLNSDLQNMEMKRRASVTSFNSNMSAVAAAAAAAANRKKSSETAMGSPVTSTYRHSLINAAVAAMSGGSGSNVANSAFDSDTSMPGSPTPFSGGQPAGLDQATGGSSTTTGSPGQSIKSQAAATNLNEVKISPSGEKREEARRASLKLQHQQMIQLQSMLENAAIDESTASTNIPEFGADEEEEEPESYDEEEIMHEPMLPPLPPPLSTPSSSEDHQITSHKNLGTFSKNKFLIECINYD